MSKKNIQEIQVSVQETYALLEQNIPFTFVDVRSVGSYNAADYTEGEGYEFMHIPYTDFVSDPKTAKENFRGKQVGHDVPERSHEQNGL